MVHYAYGSSYFDTKSNHKENRNSESRLKFCASKFVDFCKRTDLHGFKYIVMDELNRIERGCWAFAIFISIICAVFFVMTAYKWYARNPIVTVIESTQGAIWDVPFPAVTICDLNLISRRAADTFVSNLSLPAEINQDIVLKALSLAPLIHTSIVVTREQKKDLLMLQDILDLNKITIDSLFHQLSPASSCNNLLHRCMWKNTLYGCDQLFQQIFTPLSICCTFNYYAVDVLEAGYKSNLNYLPNPRRVASCGYGTALTVMIHIDTEDYFSTSVPSSGAVVLIDNPYNMPNLDSPISLVSPSTEVMIGLSPERTYTTPGVKSFSPGERQCYYYDEVKLGEFRNYSFHNCIVLQKVDIIKKACNCTPYFFRFKNKATSEDLELRETIENLSYQCLPECEHFDYPLEVAVGNLATNLPLNGLSFFTGVNLENQSVLNVFFNDLVSTRYRRDVYFNWQNLLAAFGGLLSLMLGFTLISGFDFMIFFGFKVIYDFTTMVFRGDKYLEKKRKKNRGSILLVQEHKKAIKENISVKNTGMWRSELNKQQKY
ncbi:unnamed protein product [Parnassius apollo]|uniref:(apollo) hypothetical protein n=1 Tax=Parnassius apollo TaxID=110799 RepID=A0A8S3XA04_PARAO|nr:unnamed protein product [Parnassius apollo]